jgi:hypothetical protein
MLLLCITGRHCQWQQSPCVIDQTLNGRSRTGGVCCARQLTPASVTGRVLLIKARPMHGCVACCCHFSCMCQTLLVPHSVPDLLSSGQMIHCPSILQSLYILKKGCVCNQHPHCCGYRVTNTTLKPAASCMHRYHSTRKMILGNVAVLERL